MAEQPSKNDSSPKVGIDPLAPTRIGSSDSSYNSHQENENGRSTQAYYEKNQALPSANGRTFISFEVNGRYRIDQLLGSGSFGAVYLAWDKKLERQVAFKVARRDQFESSDGRQQFIEEARASAKIQHPNIVSVHDTGEDEKGNPYVVLEYIEGTTLDIAVSHRKLSEKEIARLCAQVSEAIHVAHRIGIVHRDLKPGNILVDRAGIPHVADFGLAVTEMTQRMRRGEIAGSPVYMSPEQVRGKTQFLDGRTDIWSIGVMLYELVTGRLPFRAKVVGELYQEILEREPKPPRQINDAISPEMERICLKCLTKPIQERYPTAIDLAEDLRQFCDADLLTPTTNSSFQSRKAMYSVLALAVTVTLSFLYLTYFVPAATENRTPPKRETVVQSDNKENPSPPAPKEPEPVPGEWFPLFARDPTPFMWPFSSKNSKWEIDTHSRELWLQCNMTGMIDLGVVENDSYEVRMDLYQSPWNGGIGVYLGRKTVQEGDETFVILQLFELQCVKNSSSQRNALNHRFLKFKDGNLISRTTPKTVFLGPLNPSDEYSFHIRVQNGQIQQLKWNKLRLTEFEEEISESSLKNFRFDGAFGIYLERTSAVVRQAEFFQSIESHDEQPE